MTRLQSYLKELLEILHYSNGLYDIGVNNFGFFYGHCWIVGNKEEDTRQGKRELGIGQREN